MPFFNKYVEFKKLDILIIALFFLQPFLSYSQSKLEVAMEQLTESNERLRFAKGYMISNENDTLYGEIKWGLGSKGKRVVFKESEKAEYRCSVKEFKGFVRNGKKYDVIKDDFKNKVFMFRIMDGNVSLYMNEVTYDKSLNSAGFIHPIYLVKKNQEAYRVKKSYFRKNMVFYFYDCMHLGEKLESKLFNLSDLLLMVEYYNSKCPD